MASRDPRLDAYIARAAPFARPVLRHVRKASRPDSRPAHRRSPGLTLAPPTGEAYTPTVIGPDGAVYAVNNAQLFSCGAFGGLALSSEEQ